MAYRSLKTGTEIGHEKYRAALEEFDLSSFGESLTPVEILEVTSKGVLFESGTDFPVDTLMRLDFYPMSSKNGREDNELILCGSVSDCREIIPGELYRVFVDFKVLKSENYREILRDIKAN